MKIQRIHIKNFKSIVDLEIIEPNPFTVFVGPNGSGKSNIFEALEFSNLLNRFSDSDSIVSMFGGLASITHFTYENHASEIVFITGKLTHISRRVADSSIWEHWIKRPDDQLFGPGEMMEREQSAQYLKKNFSRVFVNQLYKEKLRFGSDSFLSTSASNLEKVLKRILQDDEKKQEIREWLDLFIPGFERVEIVSSELSSTDTLVMYEKEVQKPFTKDLLSDGTYNILALLTAVYQSDQPQFLCIEEPENGLNPYVIRKLVDFFRDACEEKGHYIWLNTHSGTLVDCLTPEEVILVDKAGGQTKIKQLKGLNLHGLDMAEAWLSGALGGGTPW